MISLLLVANASAAPDLSALGTLHTELLNAASGWLAGADPGQIRIEAAPDARAALQAAGVDRLELLVMELELGGGAVRVRTQSRLGARGPVLVDFRVDDVSVHGVARSAWTEPLVGAAADALTAAVAGDGCGTLPLAQAADLPAIFASKPGTEELVARQATALPAACAQVRGAAFSEVRVDDVAFLATAKGVAARIVKAELGLRDGGLVMEIGAVLGVE